MESEDNLVYTKLCLREQNVKINKIQKVFEMNLLGIFNEFYIRYVFFLPPFLSLSFLPHFLAGSNISLASLEFTI